MTKNTFEPNHKHFLGIGSVCVVVVMGCIAWGVLREPKGGESEPIPVAAQQSAPFLTPVQAPPPDAVPGTMTSSAVVTSVSEPMRFRAFVPKLKDNPGVMKGTGNVRVTLEFEAKDAAEVQKAFATKGVPFYLDVRPIR